MELTEKQQQMVVEYFAQKAAEDMPTDELGQEKHLWKSLYAVSLAVGRRICPRDWEVLVNEMLDLQSVNRDAEGFLYTEGYETYTPETIKLELEQNVNWEINNCLENSGR